MQVIRADARLNLIVNFERPSPRDQPQPLLLLVSSVACGTRRLLALRSKPVISASRNHNPIKLADIKDEVHCLHGVYVR